MSESLIWRNSKIVLNKGGVNQNYFRYLPCQTVKVRVAYNISIDT